MSATLSRYIYNGDRMLRSRCGGLVGLVGRTQARGSRGLCSNDLLPLHKRVEAAAARGDLDECRRLLNQNRLPSVVAEVEKAQTTRMRRVVLQLLAYWVGSTVWNSAAWAYAYRVLGKEAERVLDGVPYRPSNPGLSFKLTTTSV